MVGVIDGFRWAVLGGNTELNWIGLVSSLGTVVLAASLGVWYFRRTESRFADII
jgi:lipopolysaccharide transport system permease protein